MSNKTRILIILSYLKLGFMMKNGKLSCLQCLPEAGLMLYTLNFWSSKLIIYEPKYWPIKSNIHRCKSLYSRSLRRLRNFRFWGSKNQSINPEINRNKPVVPTRRLYSKKSILKQRLSFEDVFKPISYLWRTG